MIRQRRTDSPGLTQHVMVRAIPEVALFRDDQDRRSLLLRLARVLEHEDARVLSFALLTTHLHLLLQIGAASLSAIMHKLDTGYTLAYNARHRRHGRVLDDRFLSKVVADADYLRKVVPYVLLNPVRSGSVDSIDQLATHRWSAYGALIGDLDPIVVDVHAALRIYGDDPEEARRNLTEALRQDLTSEWEPEFDDDEAVDEIAVDRAEMKEYAALASLRVERRLVRQRVLREQWPFGDLVDWVCNRLGIQSVDLIEGRLRQGGGSARAIIAFLAIEQLGLTNAQVAIGLRIQPPAVSKAFQRGRELSRCLGFDNLDRHPAVVTESPVSSKA